jgi:hypothetical protein
MTVPRRVRCGATSRCRGSAGVEPHARDEGWSLLHSSRNVTSVACASPAWSAVRPPHPFAPRRRPTQLRRATDPGQLRQFAGTAPENVAQSLQTGAVTSTGRRRARASRSSVGQGRRTRAPNAAERVASPTRAAPPRPPHAEPRGRPTQLRQFAVTAPENVAQSLQTGAAAGVRLEQPAQRGRPLGSTTQTQVAGP